MGENPLADKGLQSKIYEELKKVQHEKNEWPEPKSGQMN